MATPVLKDVRNHFPHAHITAMCQANVAALFKHDTYLDELFSFHRPSGWIPHQQHCDIVDALRYGKYDLGVLLTNSFSSAWWFWRGHVQNRIGYANHWRSALLNEAVPLPKTIEKQHLVLTYKMLLEPLGIPLSDTAPSLKILPEELVAAQESLKRMGVQAGEQIIVGINPGAAYGTAKCWLPDRFHAVTKQLLENPKVVVIYFADSTGAPLVHEICRDLPERVISFAGKTSIRELMALIQCCSIFLTNDSGPMHIAAALKVPLLALFGSTSDVKTGPYQNGKVLHKHVDCSPCYKRICPIDFRCMKRIEVAEVYQELQKMIETLN